MGGAAKTVGRIGSGVFTLGGSELARNNLGRKSPISQALQLPGTILTGGMAGKDNMPSVFMGQDQNPYIGGPFSLDPVQMANDQANINNLGTKQYNETLGAIDQAGGAAQTYAKQSLDRMLPGIYEDLNARKLLNSTALEHEVSTAANNYAQDVANQVAQQKLGALTAKQGYESGALQRGLSLEDFINQANVAKTIGAQMAPQVNNGKAGTGAVLQGAGSVIGGLKGFK